MTVDIPMPRGNPADEKYRELRWALDDARSAVIEARKQGVSSQELLELRHRAYRAWQQLEQYLRDNEVISRSAEN
jgi:nitric oxide reductase activation protein